MMAINYSVFISPHENRLNEQTTSQDMYKPFCFWKRLKPFVWNCYCLQFLIKMYNIVEKCSVDCIRKTNMVHTDIVITRTNVKPFYSIIVTDEQQLCPLQENPFKSSFLAGDQTMQMGIFVLSPVCSLVFLIFFLLLCLCSDHHQWRHHVDPVRFWAAVLSHQGGEGIQIMHKKI